MRPVSPDKYLAITEQKRSTFDARQTLGEIALAFGLPRRLAGGVLVDLDCACHFVVEALAPTYTRKGAASALVRGHSDQVLEAIGRADAEPGEIFLAAIEYGPAWGQLKEINQQMHFGAATLKELAEAASGHPRGKLITRVTLVSMQAVLKDVRARAAKQGLDWSAPFFPPPSDPLAAKLIKRGKAEREAALRLYAEETLTRSTTEARQ
jgi:hypothetical protein